MKPSIILKYASNPAIDYKEIEKAFCPYWHHKLDIDSEDP